VSPVRAGSRKTGVTMTVADEPVKKDQSGSAGNGITMVPDKTILLRF
jgi:hypothetical protein